MYFDVFFSQVIWKTKKFSDFFNCFNQDFHCILSSLVRINIILALCFEYLFFNI